MKYKTIPLSGVKEGDEVFSILRGWGKVIKINQNCQQSYIEAIFPSCNNRNTSYFFDGRYYKEDLNPELTEARREVKTVQREGWGVITKDGKTVLHCELQPTREGAIKIGNREYYDQTIPCKITYEEEE